MQDTKLIEEYKSKPKLHFLKVLLIIQNVEIKNTFVQLDTEEYVFTFEAKIN